MPTLIYMAPPAYLLIGCLLMLAANELLDGCVTRREFVRGMLFWPMAFAYFLEMFFFEIVTRARARHRD